MKMVSAIPKTGMPICETEPEIPEKPEYPVEKFDYSRAVVEKRVFDSKMYWYPIPESEILQLKNWKQNPGW